MKSQPSVIDTIKSHIDDFSRAEQKVATYILNNTADAVSLNISDLAKASETSEATVVRFSKRLGYEGYYQMHLLLSRDFGKIESQSARHKEYSSSEKYFASEANRLTALGAFIDFSKLVEVAKLLMDCRFAHVVAAGNTIPVALDLGFRLEREGIPSTYSILPEHMYNHILLGTPEDVVVAISRSGASKHVIRSMELAHRKGCTTIAVTGERNNPLSEHADRMIVLPEKSHETRYTHSPDSHLIEFALNDAIIYAVNRIRSASEKGEDAQPEDADDIGILLSEYKL